MWEDCDAREASCGTGKDLALSLRRSVPLHYNETPKVPGFGMGTRVCSHRLREWPRNLHRQASNALDIERPCTAVSTQKERILGSSRDSRGVATLTLQSSRSAYTAFKQSCCQTGSGGVYPSRPALFSETVKAESGQRPSLSKRVCGCALVS